LLKKYYILGIIVFLIWVSVIFYHCYLSASLSVTDQERHFEVSR